jgi:hypothetical protein
LIVDLAVAAKGLRLEACPPAVARLEAGFFIPSVLQDPLEQDLPNDLMGGAMTPKALQKVAGGQSPPQADADRRKRESKSSTHPEGIPETAETRSAVIGRFGQL